MKDHVHERLGFREIDEHGNAVQAASPHVPEPVDASQPGWSINPFIIAVWVLDAGLLWFGLWAFSTVASAVSSPGSAEAAQINYLVLSNAPFALLAAALLTGGLLFWHAAQWQRKQWQRKQGQRKQRQRQGPQRQRGLA